MGIRTAAEYFQSLEKMNPVAYILGEKIEKPYRHHSIIDPDIVSIIDKNTGQIVNLPP